MARTVAPTSVTRATTVTPTVFQVLASDDASISEAAKQVAQVNQNVWNDRGRRSQNRVPFSKLISMLPLSNDDLQPSLEPIYVVGKHLAPLGLDFFHHEPIEERFAIVSLENGAEGYVQFLMKITWCRFLKPGWYDSGGKFIKIVSWEPPPRVKGA
ncbi:MAG: hypothetical protein KDA92_15985 [Planctomycetales bacterium]|nr:hypothetical protein [Planctomycetales bacterium]